VLFGKYYATRCTHVLTVCFSPVMPKSLFLRVTPLLSKNLPKIHQVSMKRLMNNCRTPIRHSKPCKRDVTPSKTACHATVHPYPSMPLMCTLMPVVNCIAIVNLDIHLYCRHPIIWYLLAPAFITAIPHTRISPAPHAHCSWHTRRQTQDIQPLFSLWRFTLHSPHPPPPPLDPSQISSHRT